MEILPPCPLTGQPALRRLQHVGVIFLRRLWRAAGAGDLRRLLGERGVIGLYESDTGLIFFHPRVQGDAEFYARFYRRGDIHAALRDAATDRVDFLEAARFVRAGDRVLDVGCGPGEFGRYLDHAHFTGLDPHAPADADPRVLREALPRHVQRAPGAYDVVCAFQVIEHVVDPLAFAHQLLALVKPGGLLVLSAPSHPSSLTRLPNFPINAPPHHLSWWNCRALAALAQVLGLEPLLVRDLPASRHVRALHWALRFSRCHPASSAGTGTGPVYFGDRWPWYLNLLVCLILGRAAARVAGLPRAAESIEAILVARRRA